MKNHEKNEEKENDIDTSIIKLREELEQKSKQIKNLQNKLDSQDIIITDYYKTKDASTQFKLELEKHQKIIKNLNNELISLKTELKKYQNENQKLKKDNIQLIAHAQNLTKKSNYLISTQNKINIDEKKYSAQEQLIKNIKNENEILIAKINNLNDIEEKSEKVINDLKNINFKLNVEKENLIQEKKIWKKISNLKLKKIQNYLKIISN